jgi:uncharacterized protein (TIGR03435 family)
MRVRGALVGLLVLAVELSQGAANAQTPQADAIQAYVPTMTFDVASVHATPLSDSYTVFFKNDPHTSMVQLQNNSVFNLLSIAYGVQGYQLVGLPNWPPPAMFTITAKSDSDADAKLAKLSAQDAQLEKQHMLQALLEDRFKLKTHWETHEGDVFNLVLAKGGSKLQPAGSMPPTDAEKKYMGTDADGKPRLLPLHQVNDGHGYDWIGHSCTMENLVSILSTMFGRPVIDKTGLTDTYDFVVKYRGRFDRDRPADDDDPTLPLDSAIKAQLGLQVEPAKGPVRVLVIDHIEKPTEN